MKRKMETSKKILLVNYILLIVLILVLIIGSYLGLDMSHVNTVTCLIIGEISITNGYYLKKSAKENVPKILGSLSDEFREQVDINQLLNQ